MRLIMNHQNKGAISTWYTSRKVKAADMKDWKSKHPEEDDNVLGGNIAIFRGNIDIFAVEKGKKILIVSLRKGVFTDKELEDAYPSFRHFYEETNYWSDNRGGYSGQMERKHNILSDGTISRQGRCLSVPSGMAGYQEQIGGRWKFPRETAFLQHHPEKWEKIVPVLQKTSLRMSKEPAMKKRYMAQKEAVNKTCSDYIVKNSVFTTIAVNNCVAAAYHQDSRDLKEGMGAMLVYRRGTYEGFELVIPEYGFALDMQHGDLVFFNPCIWHANFLPRSSVGEQHEDWERISVVMYFRASLTKALPPEEALAKVKARENLRLVEPLPGHPE